MTESIDTLLKLEQDGSYAYTLVGKTVFDSAMINSARLYTYGSNWAAVSGFGYPGISSYACSSSVDFFYCPFNKLKIR